MIIKNLRIQNGLSQEKLANITNLSTRTIQRIEKDDTGSIESLNKIARAFNISIAQLQEKLHTKENKKTETKIDNKLLVFVLVNILLFTINMISNTEYLWFIYPLLGWGIPLLYKRYKIINKIS
jgi:transcriptional regulator with XRE-family HTH domain